MKDQVQDILYLILKTCCPWGSRRESCGAEATHRPSSAFEGEGSGAWSPSSIDGVTGSSPRH
eukprot:1070063-Prorocentrum_lima.AAC.1